MANPRGRPRQFDPDQALEAALALFWRQGFVSTSLTELTEAMGLSKPSLYAAFGDKEQLYLRSLQRYLEQRLAPPLQELRSVGDGREALRGFLLALARLYASPGAPGGCFVVNGAADLGWSALPPAVAEAIVQTLRGSEIRIRERLQLAERDGQLPAGSKPADVATLLMSLVTGTAVLAKTGTPLRRLETLMRQALDALWPDPRSRA